MPAGAGVIQLKLDEPLVIRISKMPAGAGFYLRKFEEIEL